MVFQIYPVTIAKRAHSFIKKFTVVLYDLSFNGEISYIEDVMVMQHLSLPLCCVIHELFQLEANFKIQQGAHRRVEMF